MNSIEIKDLLVEKAKECCGDDYEKAFNKRFTKFSELYTLRIMIMIGFEVQVTEFNYLESLDKVTTDTVYLDKNDIEQLTKHIDDLR